MQPEARREEGKDKEKTTKSSVMGPKVRFKQNVSNVNNNSSKGTVINIKVLKSDHCNLMKLYIIWMCVCENGNQIETLISKEVHYD